MADVNTALEALTKTSPYVRAPDALQSQLTDIQAKRAEAQKARQATGQELVSQARAYQEAAGAPIPGLAEVREKQAALDIGEAPKMQPLDIKGDDLVVWGLIAALGGMATRQPALSAMNALTSAISGYQAGNKEQFERELQKYKVHADYVSKQQDKFEREAKRLMEDRTLSLEARKAGMDLLQKTYTSQKDPIDDYDKQAELIYKEIDKMRDQQFKLEVLDAKLSNAARAPQAKDIVDPTDPSRMIAVDINTYQGGGLGSLGVIGVSGKEPKAAERESKAASRAETLNTALDDSIANIDQLLSDKEGLQAITGSVGVGKLGAMFENMPTVVRGMMPKSAKAQSALNQIKAKAIFDELAKMRAASPMGGALGNVSNFENQKLGQAAAALDQAQSPEDFEAALVKFKNQLVSSKKAIQDAYAKDFETRVTPEPAAPAQEKTVNEILNELGVPLE